MDMKQKILVVEDEPEIAELIRMHMDRNGFQTTVVHSGKAGIDEIARSMPDCVLLDLMLPDLDGLEVCRRLRRHEETEKLPVIMVTAKGEDLMSSRALNLGRMITSRNLSAPASWWPESRACCDAPGREKRK